MANSIDTWIDKAIASQNQRIDEATTNNWAELRLRSEGYLEALYHVQEFINQERCIEDYADSN